jgi:hypothetical protein
LNGKCYIFVCQILGIMEPIKLGYSADEKMEILITLSHFSPKDYPKVLEDDVFWENKFKLDLELAKIHNGTAILYSIDEVEAYFDKIFPEDPIKN